ncbi:MAG: UDP-2,3-diacylglucosamine diphosphatase [Paracoccaceae bacterium]|nr:UDP-2,3-diacylglucosamine diphosphatase [Paracoccaceae bacterium]
MSHRTIFLSDIHLGAKGCQAELLASFLASHDAETIYLIGDVFDGWKLKRGWHWPQSHNDIISALLDKARAGTRVIFIPGNHDEVARNYFGTHFGGIEVKPRAEFVAADGRRFLVTHGDEFDSVVVNARWLALLGDRFYHLLLWCNPKINAVRRLWTRRYWSLSKWAKGQVKQAVSFISQYEKVLADDARMGGYDGVICGHIHHANIRQIGDILYVNTGDWVESCTAILEDHEGKLSLVDWEARIARRRLLARRGRRRAKNPTKVD